MSDFKLEKVRVIASNKGWIEGNAVSQLCGTAGLPDVEMAVGFPDLHPGKSGPVGCAIVTKELLYPHLIGNDVGCGMGLWLSSLNSRKIKLDRWMNKLVDLDQPWSGDRENWLAQFELIPCGDDDALGTIGGGNHFAELQAFERIEDQIQFKSLGLAEENLVVLVHSGSRGLGSAVLRGHQENHGHAGINHASDDAHSYLINHDYAVKWAKASRALIAYRFLTALGSDVKRVLDVTHNFVAAELIEGMTRWIHRKGANSAILGAVVIPGSRGALSYLVMPVGEQDRNANSVAHGAGRKWNRNDCRARLRERFDEASLLRTQLGSRVICEDRDLLYEEAPQAYKEVGMVVQDLVDAGIVRVIATLRPLITYKVRRNIR